MPSSAWRQRWVAAINIEALYAAPPEVLAHSTSHVPLSCPVAPPSQCELHKDGGGGGGGVARRARAARALKAKSYATSCGTSSAKPSATSCAAPLTCPSFTCCPREAQGPSSARPPRVTLGQACPLGDSDEQD